MHFLLFDFELLQSDDDLDFENFGGGGGDAGGEDGQGDQAGEDDQIAFNDNQDAEIEAEIAREA